MKYLLIPILSLFCTLTAFGQTLPDSLGFTNKAEAKNLTVNGKKEGKWCEYIAYELYGRPIISVNDTSKYISHSRSNAFPFYYYQLTVYNKGQIVGTQRLYKKNDELIFEASYSKGQENGTEKWYYNGKVFESTIFTNGKRNGTAKTYYDDGKLESECPYTNDEVNGIVKHFYESGKVKSETPVNNGVEGTTKNYDKNGNEIINLPGVEKIYYDDGTLEEEVPYTKNEKNGLEKDYYPSGKLKCEISYTNDNMDSIKMFDEREREMKTPEFFKKGFKWEVINCYDSLNLLEMDTLKLSTNVFQHKDYLNLYFLIDGDTFQFFHTTNVDTLPDEHGNPKIVHYNITFSNGKWQYDIHSNILKLILQGKSNAVLSYLVKDLGTNDVFLIKQPLSNEIKK